MGVAQCEHMIALCHGVAGSLELAYSHECHANDLFKKNKINPSKYWRRKFKPPNVSSRRSFSDVSSSDDSSRGRVFARAPISGTDSPLEWFSVANVDFKGKLGALSLVNRITNLRLQCRERHQSILRSSPEYKPRMGNRNPDKQHNPPRFNLNQTDDDEKSGNSDDGKSILKEILKVHENHLRELIAVQKRDPT